MSWNIQRNNDIDDSEGDGGTSAGGSPTVTPGGYWQRAVNWVWSTSGPKKKEDDGDDDNDDHNDDNNDDDNIDDGVGNGKNKDDNNTGGRNNARADPRRQLSVD